MGWLMGLEPTTSGATIPLNTLLFRLCKVCTGVEITRFNEITQTRYTDF